MQHCTLNRVGINGETNCFFTLKDNNKNSVNNCTACLIIPIQNELGGKSKTDDNIRGGLKTRSLLLNGLKTSGKKD